MTPNGYNSCDQAKAFFSIYSLRHAAALWCEIPPHQVNEHLEKATEVSPGVFSLPYISCLEPRCRLINDAISRGALPVCRENGVVVDEHVAPARRHLRRKDLIDWIKKEHPNDKPAFLFDEIERNTHPAINKDVFVALQADRDALKAELNATKQELESLRREKEAMGNCIDKMQASKTEINARSETTYLNIIGAMLELILGETSQGKKHSVFKDESAIKSSLLGYNSDKQGISQRSLDDKFPAARRSLSSS